MSDKQLIEDLVEMSDLIEDSGLNAFREFNINDLVRYVKQYGIQERIEGEMQALLDLDDHASYSRRKTVDADWIRSKAWEKEDLLRKLTALKDKEIE